jgi:hypothetical protein
MLGLSRNVDPGASAVFEDHDLLDQTIDRTIDET